MLNSRVSFLALFLAISTCGSASAQMTDLSFLTDSTSYLWPTNASSYLSSTFAETRSAHLHSGIDIRTWGREGYEVYATRDGVVHRIGISSGGYGKVIYLKHGDGSYSVYAHLQRYEPNLRSYADSIRMQDYQFEIDLVLNDESFTYKRGEVISYSGSTGVGPPHLHFELRSPDFRPFNPLMTNLSVQDDVPPVFSALAVETLHPETLSFEYYKIYHPDDLQSGHMDFGTIRVRSPIGLAINVHDKANRAPNKYAVYQLTLIAEQDTLFQSRADQFGFNNSRTMFLDRSYPILAEKKEGFQRLFKSNGNTLPFYHNVKNRGILAFKEGEYPITIIAEDIYGNKNTASATILFEKDSFHQTITSVPAYPDFGPNTLRQHKYNPGFNSPKSAPAYFLSGRNYTNNTPGPYGENDNPFEDNKQPPSNKTRFVPGEENTLSSQTNRAWVKLPANTLFDTLTISMEYDTSGKNPSIRFTPNRLPVNAPMQLTMLLPESIGNEPGIGLFSYDPYRNKNTFLSADIDDGVLRATINEFTELRILKDNMAPWIGKPAIADDPGGSFIVHLPSVDQDSGIDYSRSDIVINGEKGIIEYDKDKNILIYYHHDFEHGDGDYQIKATVYDRVGNRSTRLFILSPEE